MMKKICFFVLVCVFFLSVLCGSSYSRMLRLNESGEPGSLQDLALQKFKQLVEEKTAKKLEIRVYLLDQLGNPTTSIENLMMGTLDLYSGALEYYEKLATDELRPQSLLYLIRDKDHLQRYLKSPVFKKALDRIQTQGIRFLSTEWNGDRGYRVFVCTKPIFTPDDLAGVKKRIWPSDVIKRGWLALGATPVILPWGETYLAIKQGMLQGITGPLNNIRVARFTEVAKYITETREFSQTWPIAISEKVWQTLPSDQQKILVDSANEATKLYAKLTNESSEKDLQTMMRENNAVVIRVNLEPFAKKMVPFYQELIKEGYLKKEIYDAIQALQQ